MIVPSSACVLKWRLSKKLSKEHQARSYTQARKEAAMAVIPDDPDSLRARLERTNQFASLARQAVIPEPISSDPWQSMENQPFPTLSVISDRSELSGIGINVDFAESIFVSGILAPTMVNGLVAETPLRQSAIDRVLVGVDQAAERDASQEQWFD